ncbi:hypothetical protein NE234_05555 [Actinoallomurus sp. WRP9H-5]|nr:hypothetical protein [Actinoallomurus rhizosphaericola]
MIVVLIFYVVVGAALCATGFVAFLRANRGVGDPSMRNLRYLAALAYLVMGVGFLSKIIWKEYYIPAFIAFVLWFFVQVKISAFRNAGKR